MKQQAQETVRKRDVLGIEKSKLQLKGWKGKTDGGFLILTLIFLMIVAIASYYFK